MNKAPDVCNAFERCKGATGRFGLIGLGSVVGLRRTSTGTLISCPISSVGEWTRTLFSGDDCGETTEENEFFRFLLGVRMKSSGNPSWGLLVLPALEVLEKAGPRRFTAGDVRALRAWRLVVGVVELSVVGSKDRGVKNRRNDRGVTVGGLLALRRPSEAIDGGEEGGSGGSTGSDRGT